MTLGKTITTYLINGDPKGIKSVFMSNRTCQCLVIPRNKEKINEAQKRDELKTPSLYLLLKNEDRKVYIGESENFNARVIDHYKNKEFWTEAFVFVAKDLSISKTDIKYLEYLALKQIEKVNLFTLEGNINKPSEPHMPEHLRDSIKDFFEDVQILTSFLGYAIFEIPHVPKDKYMYIENKNTNASGIYENGRFRVFAKSSVRKEPTNSYENKGERQRLLLENALEGDNGRCELQKDIIFTSPSAAASFCIGTPSSGRETWKNEQGETLKELEEIK